VVSEELKPRKRERSTTGKDSREVKRFIDDTKVDVFLRDDYNPVEPVVIRPPANFQKVIPDRISPPPSSFPHLLY